MEINDMNESELEHLIQALEKQWHEYLHNKNEMPSMLLLTKAKVKYREIKRENS